MTFDTAGLTEKRNRAGTRYFERNGEIVAKECRRCDELKPLNMFHKDKNTLGGVSSRCKECANDHSRRYYGDNREERVRYANKYYRTNRDDILMYWKEFRKRNPERKRHWYAENADHAKQYAKEYRQNNRQRILKREREYRKNNKDKIREYYRKYVRDNLGKFRVYNGVRRARIHSLPSSLTPELQTHILNNFNGGCAISGDTSDIHLDHVIPISVGHGGTIYENIIPLRADLNLSKNDSCIFDWFSDNRERFGLEQRRFDELIEYLADINDMTTQEYEEYMRWCHDNPRDLAEEVDEDEASAQ